MVENRVQLGQILRGRLGAVFARHAYGMRRWVDLFAVRIPQIRDAYLAELVAEIVHSYARHARLFRERAIEHGVDPDLYVCPPEGEATYDGMPYDTDETLAYALGSLEHFGDLLAVYSEVAESPADAEVLAEVRADNDSAIAKLRELVGHDAGSAAATAHELYRVRELAEAPLYAYRH
ncbi:MAG: hypothetical protein JO325_08240 [Solirubrobacterales bacterium]|nr:hypothetical protein [Solirubrobacterales bacterium]